MFSLNKIAWNIKRILGVNNQSGYNVRCIYNVLEGDMIKRFVENTNNIVLDVRQEDEFESMHIKNAINIPVNNIDSTIYNTIPDKKTPILVYCATGDRTNYAICRLNNLGYSNLHIWGNGGINTLTVRDILQYK